MAKAGPLDAFHSRLVRIATVLLPVFALGLLSTLFILARQVNPDDAIPISDVDVSSRAQKQQLTRPRFTGVSKSGTTFDLAARTALPDLEDPRRMVADDLQLILGEALDPIDGQWAVLTADTGDIDTGTREVILTGDVRIDTSNGYRLRSERLDGTFVEFEVISPGPVNGDGPLGTLDAGGMRLAETNGERTMVFTDGVELVYTPPN